MAQCVKVLVAKPNITEFDSWDSHGGRREQTPGSCLLTSTSVSWRMREHTHTRRERQTDIQRALRM